jgi:hypothetical protein
VTLLRGVTVPAERPANRRTSRPVRRHGSRMTITGVPIDNESGHSLRMMELAKGFEPLTC